MIKSKDGEVIIYGDLPELLSDITCILGTLQVRMDDELEELLIETIEEGLRLGEILRNGGTPEDFLEELEEAEND